MVDVVIANNPRINSVLYDLPEEKYQSTRSVKSTFWLYIGKGVYIRGEAPDKKASLMLISSSSEGE